MNPYRPLVVLLLVAACDAPGRLAEPPAVDLLWVPGGTGNCWSHNRFATSFADPLHACP